MTSVLLAGVSAGYGGRGVVEDVSVRVPAGSWLGIIGPNGAGKSTLLKAIAGLIGHSGQITLDCLPVGSLASRARAKILGYAPQNPSLPEGLTVTDYVLLGRTPHLSPLGRESKGDLQLVAEVLRRLDLAGLADRPLPTLSGGERQRAVLARVLAQQASVLLLDEPTTGLDVGHAQALLDLVDRLRQQDGTTVVSTLHDLTLAAQYADRLLLLDGGRVAASGSAGEVLTAVRLATHYGARVTVLTTPDGDHIVAPIRGRVH